MSMSAFSLALNARCAYALYKIDMIAGDSESAQEHLADAQTQAYEAGVRTFLEGRNISLLLLDVELLTVESKNGFDDEKSADQLYREWTELYFSKPQPIWIGEWQTVDEHSETRPSVATWAEEFMPGIEVSHGGGDCEPCYGPPCKTLSEAKSEAERMQMAWHLGEC